MNQYSDIALRLRAELRVQLQEWATRLGFDIHDLKVVYKDHYGAGDSRYEADLAHATFRGTCDKFDWDMEAQLRESPMYSGFRVWVSGYERWAFDDDVSFGSLLDCFDHGAQHMLLTRKKRIRYAERHGWGI